MPGADPAPPFPESVFSRPVRTKSRAVPSILHEGGERDVAAGAGRRTLSARRRDGNRR
jgi:hypothetical protein